MSALVSAASGFSFAQILWVDASRVGKGLKTLFGRAKRKRKTNVAKDTDGNVKRILKVCPVKIYEKSTYCLLNTEASKSYVYNLDRLDRLDSISNEENHYGGRRDDGQISMRRERCLNHIRCVKDER